MFPVGTYTYFSKQRFKDIGYNKRIFILTLDFVLKIARIIICDFSRIGLIGIKNIYMFYTGIILQNLLYRVFTVFLCV